MPHIHLLLFLHPDDRYLEIDRDDQIICAELLDPAIDIDNSLKDIVISQMVHGPCGPRFPKAPCMTKSDQSTATHCCKNFPRAFQETTVVQEDGYPMYCFRIDGRTWDVTLKRSQIFTFDNRWVVPYNPYLTRRYEAHINVEVCATVKAVKYIHKYIYKGSDRTNIQIDGFQDEIAQHLNGRYIGPPQAIWQLWEYPTHEEFLPVHALPVHLPNEQPVYFEADIEQLDLQQRLDRSTSKLIEFFNYNRDNLDGRQFLYQEFPGHYVWLPKEKKWRPRKKKFAVGRIYHCSLTAGEKYYMRMLLTVVLGPSSFEYLRTLDDVVHPTFQAACVARGLLDDDSEWISCFTEAVTFSSGYFLQTLFGTALVHGHVSDPIALWEQFANDICDDLPHGLRSLTDVPNNLIDPHLDYGLYLLDEVLAGMGKSLHDYQFLHYSHNWGNSSANPLLAEQLDYDSQREQFLRDERYAQLNIDQKHCFDIILDHVNEHPETAHFFVHGPAGTGKTFLYKVLCNHFRAEGKIVLCVASSGIAALLLPGGITSHSRFKIPLNVFEDSVCNIKRNTQLHSLIQRTALIIWDKVPMQHKHCFVAVHRTLTDLLDNEIFFGGIPVVLGGDFAQILPVVCKGTRATIVQANIQRSFTWPKFQKLFLQQNMQIRHGAANESFAEWIGKMSYDPSLSGNIKLPDTVQQL